MGLLELVAALNAQITEDKGLITLTDTIERIEVWKGTITVQLRDEQGNQQLITFKP